MFRLRASRAALHLDQVPQNACIACSGDALYPTFSCALPRPCLIPPSDASRCLNISKQQAVRTHLHKHCKFMLIHASTETSRHSTVPESDLEAPRPRRRGLSDESCPRRRRRASLAFAPPREHAQPCTQTTTQTRTYHPRPGRRVAQARRQLLALLPRDLLVVEWSASRLLPCTPQPVRATPTQPTSKCPHRPTRRRVVLLLGRLLDPPQRQTKGLSPRFVPNSPRSLYRDDLPGRVHTDRKRFDEPRNPRANSRELALLLLPLPSLVNPPLPQIRSPSQLQAAAPRQHRRQRLAAAFLVRPSSSSRPARLTRPMSSQRGDARLSLPSRPQLPSFRLNRPRRRLHHRNRSGRAARRRRDRLDQDRALRNCYPCRWGRPRLPPKEEEKTTPIWTSCSSCHRR